LFEKWATELFFPSVESVRQKLEYGSWGILLLDGCSCHHSDEFLDTCHDVGILPVFLPAHSSHLTQPLDVGLFEIHKCTIQRVRPASWMSVQTAQVMKILGAWQAVPRHGTSSARSSRPGCTRAGVSCAAFSLCRWIWLLHGSSNASGQLKKLGVSGFE
jgi:hypothetical protein